MGIEALEVGLKKRIYGMITLDSKKVIETMDCRFQWSQKTWNGKDRVYYLGNNRRVCVFRK